MRLCCSTAVSISGGGKADFLVCYGRYASGRGIRIPQNTKSAYLQELGLSFLPVQKLLKNSTWARRYSRSKLNKFWKNRDLSQDLSQIWEVGSPEVTQLGQLAKKNEHGFSRSSEGVRRSYLNPVMFRQNVELNNFSFWKFCFRFEKSGLTFRDFSLKSNFITDFESKS